ncbi:MAG TPA: hypothetical protein VG940_02060, partial [Gemmatimonadales bacterium]|nr:hypothetical protein [Gemmatimonadales bacterium]
MPPIRRFVAAVLLLPISLAAQQGPPPGCTTPEYRQFDYWVGDWEVTDSAGTIPYGTNTVTLEESGCVVHEHWTGSRGGTGQSFNYYDPRIRKWQQDWVASNAGSSLHLVGTLGDHDTMTLEADVPGPNGTTVHHRAQWIPQPDGRVRQYWRSTTDRGKTWTIVFDGWYRKKQAVG